ncbi:hypothetical protein WJX72_009366 [[Myrmecia] bisecta]|uniref:Uncharacterized protein n=1 Tax=[Myrmecia] bisecta TaxID=41462 RepID=A0AAW1PA19_9CHLO
MTSSDRLHIALLGAGIFARDAYLPLFRQFKEKVVVVAVWSRSEAAATALLPLVHELSPNAKAVHGEEGLQQLLADAALEAVAVVLPVQVALQVTLRALAAGKHVLQEKPIAPSVAEAVKAIQAYRSLTDAVPPVWAVAENFRSEQVFRTARGLLPHLGKIIKIDLVADMPMNTKNKYFGSSWRRDAEGCPGGFLMDSSVHFIAALRALADGAGWGSEVAASGHAMGMEEGLPFPDSLVGHLVYKRGGAASVSLTFAGSHVRFSLSVVGTLGSLEVQRGGWGAGRGSYSLAYQTPSDPAPVTQSLQFSGIDDEMAAFLAVIAAHKCQPRPAGSNPDQPRQPAVCAFEPEIATSGIAFETYRRRRPSFCSRTGPQASPKASNTAALAPASSTLPPDPACCDAVKALTGFSTTLPVVVLDTQGVAVPAPTTPPSKTPNANICVCGGPAGNESNQAAVSYRGGDNTQLYNKLKEFSIDYPNGTVLLGMPSGKSWILYAQQNDTTGLKEYFGFKLLRDAGEYAPRTVFAELFVVDDGTPLAYPTHYRGVYLGLEHIDQGKHRVDVAKNTDPANVSGGYIMEYLHGEDLKGWANVTGSQSNQPWVFRYPKKGKIAPAQISYFQGYLNQFEAALYGPNFADPAVGWRQFANETSFADWFLANEFIKNAKHTYHGGMWMHKDANSTLEMGPTWVPLEGFGTCCGFPIEGYLNNGMSGPGKSGGSAISPQGWLMAVWFTRLWQDPAFQQAVAQRFATLRAGPWSEANLAAGLTELKPTLSDAAVRTISKWSFLQTGSDPATQFADSISSLVSWVTTRAQWLDTQLSPVLEKTSAAGK